MFFTYFLLYSCNKSTIYASVQVYWRAQTFWCWLSCSNSHHVWSGFLQHVWGWFWVSIWVGGLPAAQDVGLTLRRSVDTVNPLPVISVQVSASLSLQTALLMRSKVGLSHTACYDTTEVKLAVCQTLLGRGFGVLLAQCDTVIRMKDKETLSHITH